MSDPLFQEPSSGLLEFLMDDEGAGIVNGLLNDPMLTQTLDSVDSLQQPDEKMDFV